MKACIVLCCYSILSVSTLVAQEVWQRVQLKTGEVVIGRMLEKVEGKVLKLKISEKHVRSFAWEEIDTMYAVTQSNLDDWEKTSKYLSNMRDLKARGYSGVYNIGIVVLLTSSTEITSIFPEEQWSGSDAYEGVYFHFDMSHGFQFNPHIAFRVGSAVEYGKALLVPFYGEFQFNLMKRLFAPVLIISPGYAWFTDRDYDDEYYTYFNPLEFRGWGPYVACNFGFRHSFDTNSSLQLTAGLRYHSVSDESAKTRVYGINVRFGYEF